MNRFGFYADPSKTIRANFEHLLSANSQQTLPKLIKNKEIWNLCRPNTKLPDGVEDILGLNLNFGINFKPKLDEHTIDFTRLRRSIRLRFIPFESKQEYNPKLYIPKSGYVSPAPKEIETAIDNFEAACKTAFSNSRRRPHHPNVTKTQVQLLRALRKERRFIAIATDKNLGPAILELDQYIERAFLDHLHCTDTYREISTFEANSINNDNFRWICDHCYNKPLSAISRSDRMFFANSLFGDRDGINKVHPKENITFPYFYLLPKVHKVPLPDFKTRPVVSGVSSVMEPLSKFLDVQLQRVVHLCPCYLKDSWQFLNDIRNLKNLQGYKLITSDANSMYTNINTEHAISIIKKWMILHHDDIPNDFPTELVIAGIEQLMKYNVFSFGNRYFLQRNGTAMGTNVACMYATIYYSYHEETHLLHQSYIKFYCRLIDDAFIVFDPDDRTVSSLPFQSLQNAMDSFGPKEKRLTWDTEQPSLSVNFLDLTVTLLPDGTLRTKTFQKSYNRYLLRTPLSCQPDYILKSFVYGAIHRYFWQNALEEDFVNMVTLLKQRMENRGHHHHNLLPLFHQALQKVATSSLPNPRPTTNQKLQNSNNNNNDMLFLHLPYHPNNPTRPELRELLSQFKNDLSSFGLPLQRIIIAYSKAPNIGDICKRHRLEGFIDTHLDDPKKN